MTESCGKLKTSNLYSKLGLRVGLEVHQQLDTDRKLFCNCPTRLSVKEPTITFLRRLRPTQSELGQADPAALFEFQRGRIIQYEADEETSCPVELDEEPPHNLNPEAIDIALSVALMVGSKPMDEVHVMRKVVIDGSNTTGFQRTCIISLGGAINIEGSRPIPLQHVGLEEDAARKIDEFGMVVRYRLDRLGTPLIEVTTAPVIHSPKEAGEVAYIIGRVLRATGRVKRGLGTIRQDINISIIGGALIEVKGVQKLELVSKIVEFEVQRQLALLKIKDELKARGLEEGEIKEEFIDVTELFKNTSSPLLREALREGKVVLAAKLPKFSGLLKVEVEPKVKLGTEMAYRAVFWGRVKGIIHTDELPGYGVNEFEVDELKRRLKAGSLDAVVIVADTPENASDALKAVIERAKEALKGVPEETRAPNPDGTTHYMRPRPGAARMYPETDIPPIPIDRGRVEEVLRRLPPMPDAVIKRLMESYGLNKKLAEQLTDSEYLSLFEDIASKTKIPASFIATTLTEVMKSLEREGVPIENLTDEHIEETFKLVDSQATAKESVRDIISWLAKNPKDTPTKAIESLRLRMLAAEELEALIRRHVNENIELIKSRREASLSKLMSITMKEVRGRADVKTVEKMLREKIEETLKANNSNLPF